MENDIRLEVRSDPRLLGTIRNVVRGWVDAYGFSSDRADEVMLAIDEACSNVIRHAYEGRCEHTVELMLQSDDDFLEFRVCDQGIPCPPEHVRRRELKPPDLDDLRPGGLGVQLMYEVFDEVQFSSGSDGGNCVVMRLKRPE